ncbi:MAG TPA: VWA domain-containing protein [Candidatus Acidoferrum sp.]|jgi:VWFA-related protein
MKPALIRPTFGAFVVLAAGPGLLAQSGAGPITPPSGVAIQQAPPQKIVSRVLLVNTPVTVRDAKGQMVSTLAAKDFQVTDNGAEQRITHFDLGGDPLSIVILVETSSRIAPLLPQIQKTGIVFTEAVMGPNGEAAIVGFNDGVDKLQDFTPSHDEVEKAITHLQSGTSGCKLYDAMAVGVEMLTARPQATPSSAGRRRVLLIVSEAGDGGSEAKLGAVLRLAQLSNITIYSVGISTLRAEMQTPPKDTRVQPSSPGGFPMPPLPGTPQTPTSEDARYGSGNLANLASLIIKGANGEVNGGNPLELATAATGGAHLPTFKDRSIEKAMDEIGGELHSQYSLSYTPTGDSVTGYHEIKIVVDQKGLKVRARPGYYLAPDG